jgi:hypothetical protein
VGLGTLTGFGVVHPLPGIWDGATLNTAITLPIGVEAYAVYALAIATDTRPLTTTGRRYAWASAAAALLLGMAGQIAYHLMDTYAPGTAPWWIIAMVSCLPVLVLGAASLLWHLTAKVVDPTPDDVTGWQTSERALSPDDVPASSSLVGDAVASSVASPESLDASWSPSAHESDASPLLLAPRGISAVRTTATHATHATHATQARPARLVTPRPSTSGVSADDDTLRAYVSRAREQRAQAGELAVRRLLAEDGRTAGSARIRAALKAAAAASGVQTPDQTETNHQAPMSSTEESPQGRSTELTTSNDTCIYNPKQRMNTNSKERKPEHATPMQCD